MNDPFQAPQRLWIFEDAFCQFGAIHPLGIGNSREFGLDQGNGFAGVKSVYGQISVVNRYAGLGKKTRRRRLAHSDRAGETDYHHSIVFLETAKRPNCRSASESPGA